MATTTFTALGMSGSGKTCYVLGMYYEMCVGVRGFNLVTSNDAAYKLEEWMEILDDETGADRFPAGTGLTEVTNYNFSLSHQNHHILSFDWMDYGGRTLKERDNNPDAYESLTKSIENSTALYIFIDGELLACDSPEKRMANVKRKIARTVNGYITDFEQKHDGYTPPIIFVITKIDLCHNYLKDDEIDAILKEAFSPVFGDDKKVYMVPVSLGSEISDDDYSGDVEPVNIHIPFFLGIYHEFYNVCVWAKNEILKKKSENYKAISENEMNIYKENNRFFSFMRKEKRIEESQKNIAEAEDNITALDNLLDEYKKLLGVVASELDKMSGNFHTYVNGLKVDFSHEETYTF